MCFLVFSSLIINLCQKSVFKAIGRLLFNLFIINQYCMPNVILQKMCVQSKQEPVFFNSKTVCLKQVGVAFLIQNMCSKQARGCFLIYSAAFLIQKMWVQTKWGLLFNLLSYFCNTKNVCSNQAGAAF